MFIQTEATPNPEVLKFLPGRDVMGEGTRDFREVADAGVSPLAAELFAIGGVERVFFGPDFLTVGKLAGYDWAHLKAPILAAVMDHYTSGQPLFLDGSLDAADHDEGVYEGETAQIVAEIKDLLDTRIRPAVAQDGGDILFSRFDERTGVVYLNMRGACSGCPSSSATLKAGVENMLKHYVPEVTAVETNPLNSPRMIVLGLDTCLSSCSVAILDGERVVGSAREVMARGHQERLASMAREVMAGAGLAFDRLERIAVTVGPGSFTGLRVGIAFAKGLALALDKPAAGIGTLEALAAEAKGLVFAAIDARRDQLYLQGFEDGRALMAPDALTAETAAARVAELSNGRAFTLVGSGAPLLADLSPGAPIVEAEGCDAVKVARLAAARAPGPLKPLYLRAPDAKLPA